MVMDPDPLSAHIFSAGVVFAGRKKQSADFLLKDQLIIGNICLTVPL